MKTYKYPKTKKLINKLRPFYKEYKKISDRYYKKLYALENKMSKIIGIPEIEFFFCDNELAGIGNMGRTMELIHIYNDLEE
jgi:hypothetical protein